MQNKENQILNTDLSILNIYEFIINRSFNFKLYLIIGLLGGVLTVYINSEYIVKTHVAFNFNISKPNCNIFEYEDKNNFNDSKFDKSSFENSKYNNLNSIIFLRKKSEETCNLAPINVFIWRNLYSMLFSLNKESDLYKNLPEEFTQHFNKKNWWSDSIKTKFSLERNHIKNLAFVNYKLVEYESTRIESLEVNASGKNFLLASKNSLGIISTLMNLLTYIQYKNYFDDIDEEIFNRLYLLKIKCLELDKNDISANDIQHKVCKEVLALRYFDIDGLSKNNSYLTKLRKITANSDGKNLLASEFNNILELIDILQKAMTPIHNGQITNTHKYIYDELTNIINLDNKFFINEILFNVDKIKKNSSADLNKNLKTILISKPNYIRGSIIGLILAFIVGIFLEFLKLKIQALRTTRGGFKSEVQQDDGNTRRH